MKLEINKLLEKELKSIALNYLLIRGDINQASLVINEFTLDNFTRRTDLSVVNDGRLIAFEIKSEFDSLTRLSGQTQKYLQYFDKVIVVSVSKHISKIMNSVPQNVGVWEVSDGRVIIRKRGCYRNVPNKVSYLDLLNKKDLIKLSGLIKKINSNKYTKKDLKRNLEDSMENLPSKFIKSFFISVITERFQYTSKLFVENVLCKNRVDSSDIDYLSPYSFERKNQKNEKIAKIKLWQKLKKGLDDDPFLAELARDEKLPLFGVVPASIKKILED